VNYGTLPVYITVTVSVQIDVNLPELQQHLLQRWTAFHSSAMCISWSNSAWPIQTPLLCMHTFSTCCNVR